MKMINQTFLTSFAVASMLLLSCGASSNTTRIDTLFTDNNAFEDTLERYELDNTGKLRLFFYEKKSDRFEINYSLRTISSDSFICRLDGTQAFAEKGLLTIHDPQLSGIQRRFGDDLELQLHLRNLDHWYLFGCDNCSFTFYNDGSRIKLIASQKTEKYTRFNYKKYKDSRVDMEKALSKLRTYMKDCGKWPAELLKNGGAADTN